MKERLKSWGWLYNGLGAVVGALAFVSLAQRYFEIGIAPILAGALESYRAVIHPLAQLVFGWLGLFLEGWAIPDWIKDLGALSFLGASVWGRLTFKVLMRAEEGAHDPRPVNAALFAAFVALIVGATFIGVLVVALWPLLGIMVVAKGIGRRRPAGKKSVILEFLYTMTTGAAGAALFFIVNAQLR